MDVSFRCIVAPADLRAVTEWLRVLSRIIAVLVVVILVVYAGVSPHEAYRVLGPVR
jgi:hypothetical protein